MYKNIGKKIKLLAKIFFWIEFVISEIFILLMIIGAAKVREKEIIIAGIICIFLAPVICYMGNMLLYGFGEMIDKVCDIEKNTRINKKTM